MNPAKTFRRGKRCTRKPELEHTLAHCGIINGAARCISTERLLTHSLDLGEEGLAVKATHVPARGPDRSARIPELTPKQIQHFYSKLRPGGCGVVWADELNSQGYGRFSIQRNNKRIRILAHRLAYKLATGEDPVGWVVRHGCDTPPCCTPDCLTLGTHRDNSQDAVERGRTNTSNLAILHELAQERIERRLEVQKKFCPRCKTAKPFTEFHRNKTMPDGFAGYCKVCKKAYDASDHPRRKLNEDLVREIKRRIETGNGDGLLAAVFHVSPGQINNIRIGRRWGHVK